MADPTSADPATIATAGAAALTAAGTLLHRVLDVGSVRKRLKVVEAAYAALRAEAAKVREDLDALAERVSRRRTDTGSQPRVTVQPPPPPQQHPSDPALLERTSAMSGRMAEIERRLTGLEEQADARVRWEGKTGADVARIEGLLEGRAQRARERESRG